MLERLLNPIPWPYRVAAVAGLALALYGAGYLQGRLVGQRELDAYKQEVAVAAAQQATITAAKISQQKQITQETADAYAQNMDALRLLYERRLRSHPVRPGAVPAVPGTPGVPDAGPADPGPGAGDVAAEDQCLELKRDAALTTLQLLSLQGWVQHQLGQ